MGQMKTQYSQLSPSQKRLYQRKGIKYADPIWVLMKNPLFVGKINTLLIQSREKWNNLERDKVFCNPFYKPIRCPVSVDALTWISAYLRFYFLPETDNGDNLDSSLDDLVRVFNILLNSDER